MNSGKLKERTLLPGLVLSDAKRKLSSYEKLVDDAINHVYVLEIRMRAPRRHEDANTRARRLAQLRSDARVAEDNLMSLRAQRDAQRVHVGQCEQEVRATWAALKAATNTRAQEERRRERVRRDRENAQRERIRREKENAQRQRARQDQERQSNYGKPPPRPEQPRQIHKGSKQGRKPSAEVIEDYFHTVDIMLADYATLTAFPTPLAWPCSNAACECTKATRSLQACACNIKYLFNGRKDLKSERLRFHPDRFSKVPEHLRESFQQMAHEIFVVVDEMYSKKRAAQEV